MDGVATESKWRLIVLVCDKQKEIMKFNDMIFMLDRAKDKLIGISFLYDNGNAAMRLIESVNKSLSKYCRLETKLKEIHGDDFGIAELAELYMDAVTSLNDGKEPRKIIFLSDEDVDLWNNYKRERHIK